MTKTEQISKNSFLYPQHPYHGQFTPEYLTFNANLQEFAHRVSYITALQTGGKLSPDQAYEQMKSLWKQLKQSKKAMNIGTNLPPEKT